MGRIARRGGFGLLLFCLGLAGPAEAARLFQPGPAGLHTRSALTGVGGVRLLTVDPTALAGLRGTDRAVVDDFPLGSSRSATVELERFEPFPAHARVEIMEASGPRALALPDRAYFRGQVRGEPGSRVFVVAGPTSVQGFVTSAGDVFPFGPDSHGRHRSYALTQADPTQYPPPKDFCVNDLEPQAVEHPTPSPMHAAPDGTPVIAAAVAGSLRIADLAIETDNELRAKFASDNAALDYLTSLLAASTAIYERDVNVRLQYSYIRLWAPGVSDPWTSTSPSGSLSEVLSYWNNAANNMNAIAGSHDVVHFISGKSVQGGVAYVDVLCFPSYAYGVSQVYGSFDLSNPNAIWDLVVFTHELGHNFGSSHSHCYNPPLDKCYNGESGCYSGAVVASRGTLMSYCHLLSGGLSNIDLTFGDTVSARIRTSVDAAACLATTSTTTTTLSGTTSTTASATTTTSTTTTTRPTTTTSTTLASTTTVRATTTTTIAVTTTTAAGTTSTTSPPPTTTSTTAAASTSTVAPTTTTTTPSTTVTATTAVVTTTTADASSSTTVSTTTVAPTTSTLAPAVADGDADGVPDARDLCIGTATDDLVDGAGCSVCPCSGPRGGGEWRSHAQYVRCVRAELFDRGEPTGVGGRAANRTAARHAQQSTCGRRTTTRCCLDAPDGSASCRIMRAASCEVRAANGTARDAGTGSCTPSPCDAK